MHPKPSYSSTLLGQLVAQCQREAKMSKMFMAKNVLEVLQFKCSLYIQYIMSIHSYRRYYSCPYLNFVCM